MSNTYLVTSGLPWQGQAGEAHARTLALFALDALLTIESVPFAAMSTPLTAKVGLHTGPLTAGLIGQTRRYYRIFGDTVNVSSRMMSTGKAARVQASEATARSMLGLDAAAVLPFRLPGDAVQLFIVRNGVSDCIRVSLRGDTFVKGKGLMKTYWLEPNDPQDRASTQSRSRTVLQSANPPSNLFVDRVCRELRWRTETFSVGSGASKQGVSTGSSSKTSGQTVHLQHPVPSRHTVRSMTGTSMSSRMMVFSSSRTRSPRPPPLPDDLRVPSGSGSAATAASLPAPPPISIPARIPARSSRRTLNAQMSPFFREPLQGQPHVLPGAVSSATDAAGGVLPFCSMTDGGLDTVPAASASAAAAVVSTRFVAGKAITARQAPTAQERPGITTAAGHSPVHAFPLPASHVAAVLSTHHAGAMPQTGWVITEQNGATAAEAVLTDYAFSGDDLPPSLGAAGSVVFHDSGRDEDTPPVETASWRSWLRSTVLGEILATVHATAARSSFRLRFDDAAAEGRATRELFSHTLRGTAAVMGVWCACFVGALVLASALPDLGSTRLPITWVLVAPIVASAVVGGAAFVVLHHWLPHLSGTMQRMLGWVLLASCLCGMAVIVWFCLGPGARARANRASAAFAGISNDSGASPFEGQIIMSLVIVTFMQCMAHIRLPVAHTAVIAVACCVFTIGFAVSGITSTPGWPSDAVGLGVWAVVVGVSSNAFTATMASFAWEARCRSQQLMAAAARAAEAEATALLENLLPPVVVAEYKAGRVTKPALAHDVVILWGDIVGFTSLASRLEPLQLMAHLNTIYR